MDWRGYVAGVIRGEAEEIPSNTSPESGVRSI